MKEAHLRAEQLHLPQDDCAACENSTATAVPKVLSSAGFEYKEKAIIVALLNLTQCVIAVYSHKPIESITESCVMER